MKASFFQTIFGQIERLSIERENGQLRSREAPKQKNRTA
jgi:hypothetical protein